VLRRQTAPDIALNLVETMMAFIAAKLPDYMIPSALLVVEKLPRHTERQGRSHGSASAGGKCNGPPTASSSPRETKRGTGLWPDHLDPSPWPDSRQWCWTTSLNLEAILVELSRCQSREPDRAGAYAAAVFPA